MSSSNPSTLPPVSANGISVIIPTLNEERHISQALANVRCVLGEETEVIVVDGGSRDRTVAHAGTASLVLQGTRGRGKQMNMGANHATGEILLFLHADTRLPRTYRSELTAALNDSSVTAGYSPITFDHPAFMLRVYARLSHMACGYFHYGDGAVFVRRQAFRETGRYAEIPLFEDLDLLSRLRKRGKTALLPSPVQTSARRFLQQGIVLNQIRNIFLVMLYMIGFSPHLLSRWYYPPYRDTRVG
jgi:rSAM/selenodomain-associated transferase 2